MNPKTDILRMGKRASKAAGELAQLSERNKNTFLEAMATALQENREGIKEANARDMESGKRAGLNDALLDRLELTDKRIDGMINMIHNVVALTDPVGSEISSWMRPNGLEIKKIRVPIGVIGIIYESRPNVTCDAAALCLKTSNAVILRGGKESIESNRAIVEILQEAGKKAGLPENALQFIRTTDRDAVRKLVQMEEYLDLAIPRGGEGLIRAVTEMARVPVIKHYKGLCHVYVDKEADLKMALEIAENAKCQRPGVCNAIETLLVDQDVASEFLPKLISRMEERGVELRGDATVRNLNPAIKEASEEDWETEYLDLVLSVRVVAGVEGAIEHINRYGSHHSDAIVSDSKSASEKFLARVDSATVYVNASTRFTDGGEFGLGAEIGISTNKLHARGPMGLEELTTYKFVVNGTGQIRE